MQKVRCSSIYNAKFSNLETVGLEGLVLVEHLVEVEVGVGNGLAYQPGLGAKEVGEHPRYIKNSKNRK